MLGVDLHVDHRRLQVLVTEDLAQRRHIARRADEPGGEGVAEDVGVAELLGDAGAAPEALDEVIEDRVGAGPAGVGVGAVASAPAEGDEERGLRPGGPPSTASEPRRSRSQRSRAFVAAGASRTRRRRSPLPWRTSSARS